MSDHLTICACGCGETFISKTYRCRGETKQQAYKPLHHLRMQNEDNNVMWRGGKTRGGEGGYIRIRSVGHPRAKGEGHYVSEHVLVMEKHLGRFLRDGEIVHHKNEIKSDNRIENLMLFSSSKEHLIEHRKMRAFKACKNREWLVCRLCGKYDDPKNLVIRVRRSEGSNAIGAEHKTCRQRQQKEWRMKNRPTKKQLHGYADPCPSGQTLLAV